MDTVSIVTFDLKTFVDTQVPSGKNQSSRRYENIEAKALSRFLYDGCGKKPRNQRELLQALLQTRHMNSSENRAFAITSRLVKINLSYAEFEKRFFVLFDADSTKGAKSDDFRTLTGSELDRFAKHWDEIFQKENCIWHGWVAQCFHELKKNGKYGDPQQDMLQYILYSLP